MAQATEKKLTLGIRPQDLSPELASEASIECVVDVIEPMGTETYYHFSLGELQLVGRSEGDARAAAGESARFGVSLSHLHIFTGDGTRRLN